jgi:hypothetical protein
MTTEERPRYYGVRLGLALGLALLIVGVLWFTGNLGHGAVAISR